MLGTAGPGRRERGGLVLGWAWDGDAVRADAGGARSGQPLTLGGGADARPRRRTRHRGGAAAAADRPRRRRRRPRAAEPGTHVRGRRRKRRARRSAPRCPSSWAASARAGSTSPRHVAVNEAELARVISEMRNDVRRAYFDAAAATLRVQIALTRCGPWRSGPATRRTPGSRPATCRNRISRRPSWRSRAATTI